MTLPAACDNLATLFTGMTGIARVYGDPPDSVNELPALLVYPSSGTLEAVSGGLNRGLHVVSVDVIQARQVMASAVNLATEWPERVFAVLQANPTLSGAVDAIVWPVSYRIMPMRYGSDTLFGARFEIRVKILS